MKHFCLNRGDSIPSGGPVAAMESSPSAVSTLIVQVREPGEEIDTNSYEPASSFSDGLRGKLANWVGLSQKKAFILFCLALSVSAFCKLSRLNSRELWLDETYSAFVANLRFSELLRYTAGDVHPPLYYMLLWAWVRIGGDAQAQLRLFTAVLSICAAIGMFLLAQRSLGSRFGVLAAALFAFSPMLFVYSLEIRMYMLSLLLFICLLLVHWIVVVERSEAKWLVVAFGILAALLFYVHYIAVFVLLGLFVHWTIATSLARGRIAKLCAAGALTFILISPGIPVLLQQRAAKARLDQALEFSHRDPSALSFGIAEKSSNDAAQARDLAKSVAAMAGFYPAASPLLLLVCAVPLAVALTGAGFLWVMKGDEVCRLFGTVMLAMGIGVLVLHLYRTRYMLALVPLLVLAIARTVQYGAAIPRWRVPSLATGTLILCLYAAGFFRQTFMPHGHPWQDLVSGLQQNYQPGDKIVFDALYAQVPFDYFARQVNFQPQEDGFPLSIYDWWRTQEFKGWGGPVITHYDLNRFVSGLPASGGKTMWLVLNETYYYDPHDALLESLRQFGQVTEFSFPQGEGASASEDDSNLRLIRISLK
jgi:hypothetical protein